MHLCVAGLLMGATIGLKLTMASYGVAAVVSLALIGNGWRKRLRSTAWFGVASLAGFAIVEADWAISLSREFGSPFFPLYNSWFRSPYAHSFNWVLTSQKPANWNEFVFYPFYFIQPQMKALEVVFQDVRLALVFFLAVLVVLAKFCSWWRQRGASKIMVEEPPHEPKNILPLTPFVLVFCLVGYLVWHVQFHILRYLCPVMMLAPLLIVILLALLLNGQRRILCISAIAAFTMVGGAEVESYGRLLWRPRFFDTTVPTIEKPRHAVLLTTWELGPLGAKPQPLGYVLPAFPAELRCIRLDSTLMDPSLKMHREVREILKHHTGPIYLLIHLEGLNAAVKRLSAFGLAVNKKDYEPIPDFVWHLGLWRVNRIGDKSTAVPRSETSVSIVGSIRPSRLPPPIDHD
jgi:hypothetical protein